MSLVPVKRVFSMLLGWYSWCMAGIRGLDLKIPLIVSLGNMF